MNRPTDKILTGSARGAARTGRGPGRPPNTDGDTTRQTILDAARECFASQGYAATSNRDIGAKAGVTNSVVHYHFGRKSDLMRAVYQATESQFYTLWRNAIDGEEHLAERVDALFDGLHRMITQDSTPAAFMLVARQEFRRHAELADQRDDNAFFTMGQEIARRAVDDGELDDAAAQAVAHSVILLFAGLMNMGLEMPTPAHRDATDASKHLLRTQLRNFQDAAR